jgi:hypothetical protein
MNLLSGSLGYRQVTTPNVGTGHVIQVAFLLLKAEKFVTARGILHAEHFKLVIVGYITFCWVQTRIFFLCHSCGILIALLFMKMELEAVVLLSWVR